MSTLTVALPLSLPTPATVWQHVWSADGRGADRHGGATLELLPRAERLVLVVPAQALSWHVVQLPPVSAGRRRAALEGLLEDRLLDDPAALALALGPQSDTAGRRWVAACDRAWLAAALQAFEQAGRPASRVVPELAPVAEGAPPRLRMVGEPDAPGLLVADAVAVVHVPLSQWRALFPGAGGLPDGVDLAAPPPLRAAAERELGCVPAPLEPAQHLLAAAGTAWELAQFDLAVSPAQRRLRRIRAGLATAWHAPRWRWMRRGLAAALLVQFAGLQAWAWQLDAQVASRRAELVRLLTQTFPKVRAVVDAPLQMERELALLRQTGGALSERDLESLLAALGSVLPAGRDPAALDFSGGQLVVRGLTLSPEQFSAAATQLGARGYTLRQEASALVLRAAPGGGGGP